MKKKTSSPELRSEEVQEILSSVPHWIVGWGSIIVFAILMLIFYVAWLVKYPDIISTQVVITTAVPPQKLVTKTSGKIEAILVKDRAIVHEDSPLAVIENSAKYQDIFVLKSILDTIRIERYSFPFEKLESAQLGEIESPYAIFHKEYIAAQLNLKLKPFAVQQTAQSSEAVLLKERLDLLESQKNINQKEIELEKIDLARYENLFKKGIVATQEVEKHRLTFLQSERNYISLLNSISQIKSSLNDLEKNHRATQIDENREDVNLETNVIQAFHQLKKAVIEWELNYILRSSIEGKLSYLQLWAENQTVMAGDHVFTVIPTGKNSYIGKAKAPVQNSGKIKTGQIVNIRLSNFPNAEFGIINGKVRAISLTPDKDGNFLIDVSLPQGLTTSYKRNIPFQQEMAGNADIVTQDLRLIERLLYQFKDIFSR